MIPKTLAPDAIREEIRFSAQIMRKQGARA
jgi:hypothetical protein